MLRSKGNAARLRSYLCGSSALAMAFAWSAFASAQSEKATLDIPSQPLSSALQTFSVQSNSQVLFSNDMIAGREAPSLKGEYEPRDALAILVRGTGLRVAQSAEHVFLIEAADRSPAPEAPRQVGASVETVVVTAQHKKEDIQQVPIAITALSQQQLTERQIAGGPDLLKSVPNMAFTKTNFSGYDIELRGIGTQAISVTTDPAVAVAFNDTPFIRNHFFEQEFFDLQDVEVLLGPQGTLYGRNATAGVVNLKSALPTDQYEAMLSADLGNYSNRRLEGMLNIPIVGDKLDIRFAGEWTKRDGYTTDTTLGIPVDGRDLWSGRMTIGWNPTSNFHSDFVWEHFSEDDDRLRSGKQLCKTDPGPTSVNGVPVPPGTLQRPSTLNADFLSQGCEPTSLYSPSAFEVPNGFALPYNVALSFTGVVADIDPYASTVQSTNLRQIQSAILPSYKAKNDTLEYNATYNINPALTLTSQTGYNHDFLWSSEDYNRFDTSPGIFTYGVSTTDPTGSNARGSVTPDPMAGMNGIPQNSGQFCDPQLGCADRLVAQDLDVEHAWQMSQEFRLASNFGGPFNFSLGANYLHYETEENYYVFINGLSLFTINDGDHSAQGSLPYIPGVTDNSGCLQHMATIGAGFGWQLPNPKVSGGEPTEDCIYMDPNSIGNLNNKGHNYFLSQNPYTLNSYALFGETYYNITNALKLTMGARWTIDDKHFVDIPSELLAAGYGYAVSGIVNQQWSQPTGRAVLDWAPDLSFTDQTLLYVSAAHGYKAGGANPPGAAFLDGAEPIHPLTFKPEYIEAFELGTKNTLLDGSLTLNGDFFYYNYTGYQVSEIVDRTAINNNYNAHVEGAEVSANWEPVPGLKFNFAGGWEDTAAAGGDSGIDLMDRTAGMPGWMVVKPFVTETSNCILPTYVVQGLLEENSSGRPGGASNAAVWYGCDQAYLHHVDPVTLEPYQTTTPTIGGIGYPGTNPFPVPGGYPGFNPATAPNNGEGFSKNLSGHALPNAPPFTVSLGGEYSVPVSEDWVATLRSDFYWQADSWARIFNDNPYDRLHGYTNVNLALLLTSANGWQVMGYIKNVFNTTAITGDFLNSDDSGLTTNVFLTDPRLYGIRVTKHLDENDGFWGSDWNGANFFTDLFADKDGGEPALWIELGGQMEHTGGQGAVFAPGFLAANPKSTVLWNGTSPTAAQRPPRDFGEEAKISFQPDGSDWVISASIRYSRSSKSKSINHQTGRLFKEASPVYPSQSLITSAANFSETQEYHEESHAIIDFSAGKDVGLGLFGENISSTLSAGVRYAQFASRANVDIRARPDLHIQYKYLPSSGGGLAKVPGQTYHNYHATGRASRSFHGIGPTLKWNGSIPVAENSQDSGVAFDWGANVAILFGRQRARVAHQESAHYAHMSYLRFVAHTYAQTYQHAGEGHTSNRAIAVPNLGGFAGISYRYQNAKISFGYRADLFFGAIDGGIDKRKSETLNMGGPFATISFGLGG